MNTASTQWWSEEHNFFGDFYIQGDNSINGYLIGKKQTLQERTAAEVQGVLKLLELSPPASILDIPCGYGRHSIALTQQGFSVTGSDLNSRHLSVAGQAASQASISVNFQKENMLGIQYQSEFDVVINLFYSFGFFETDEENFKVLQNFFRALKPGGQFLMHTDVNIPRLLTGKYRVDETRTLPDGGSLRIIDQYDPLTKRINGSWILTTEQHDVTEKDYSVRVYTEDEFIDLCVQAGFQSCTTYADWDGTPYSPDAEDMIIIARK